MKYYGILIDPSRDEVVKVEMANSVVGLSDLYSSIGCEMVERMAIGFLDDYSIDLWIDEEGMLNGASERIGCFSLGDNIMYGRGLIILCDLDGESIAFDSEDEQMERLARIIRNKVSIENQFNYA